MRVQYPNRSSFGYKTKQDLKPTDDYFIGDQDVKINEKIK